MQISKFNPDAKIVERWGASHEVGILQQIGAMKPVPHLDEPPVLSAPASAGKIWVIPRSVSAPHQGARVELH